MNDLMSFLRSPWNPHILPIWGSVGKKRGVETESLGWDKAPWQRLTFIGAVWRQGSIQVFMQWSFLIILEI
jgi:hypothetical protein